VYLFLLEKRVFVSPSAYFRVRFRLEEVALRFGWCCVSPSVVPELVEGQMLGSFSGLRRVI
jgi:hypothetical protein